MQRICCKTWLCGSIFQFQIEREGQASLRKKYQSNELKEVWELTVVLWGEALIGYGSSCKVTACLVSTVQPEEYFINMKGYFYQLVGGCLLPALDLIPHSSASCDAPPMS
jgi:hypothetical protein